MSTPQHSSRTASRAQSPSISPLPANSILNIDPPPLFVGQGFADFKTFKDKLTDWAISAKFYTRTKKSDAKRVIVDCASPVCAFHVRAYMCARRGCVVVGTLMAEHTCTPEAMANKKRAPASKQAWIQRVLPETIDVTRDTTPTQIIEAIQKKWNHTIRYEAAQRAKSMALAGTGAGLIGGGGGSGANGGGGVSVQGGVMAATRTKLHPALPPPPPPTPPQQQQHQQQHQQQVHLQQQQQVHQQQQQKQQQQQRQQQHRQAQQQQQNQNQNHLQGGGINPSQTISTPTPTPTQQQHHANTITNFHHHHALPTNNLLFSPPLPAPQPSPPSAATYSPPQQPAPVPAPLAPPVPPAPPAPLAPPAPPAHPVTPPSAKRGPEYDARAIRIAITDPLLAPYARASHPWRGKSVFLRYGMLRGPTLRDLLRCIQRHLPQGRVPYYITGAISTEDVPAADEVGHSEDLEGGGETGTVVLKDDDDIEAWWWISTASPMEVQVVLDSPSDPAGDMARILGVEAVNGVGVKRPRVDVGVWEEVLDEENGGRRRRVG